MSGKRRWEPARSDYFARVPFRLDQALATRDLTCDQYLVLVFLVVRIQRAGTPVVEERGSPEVAFTLRGLADALAWEKSEKTLGRVLRSLREDDWIAFPEGTKGQRRPYVISLRAAAIDGEDDRPSEASHETASAATSPPPGHHLDTGDPSGVQVTSTASRSEAPSNPLPEREAAESPPPRRLGAREEKEKENQPSLRLGLSRRPQKARTDEAGKSDEAEESPSGKCTDCDRLGPLVALSEEDEPSVCGRCALLRLNASIGREMLP